LKWLRLVEEVEGVEEVEEIQNLRREFILKDNEQIWFLMLSKLSFFI